MKIEDIELEAENWLKRHDEGRMSTQIEIAYACIRDLLDECRRLRAERALKIGNERACAGGSRVSGGGNDD